MTVTETPPTVADVAVESPSPTTPLGRLVGVVSTGEHKTIGRLYVLCSLGFALFALVLGVLVGLEQTDLDGIDVVGAHEAYLQVFGLWRTGLVFLVVVPLFIGLATAVVPLQLGAPSIAFPRAAASSLWAWLVGSGLYIGGTFADGGFNAGGDTDAIELTVLGMIVMIVALLAATVCIMTTVVAERPQGMSLGQVPVFSWTMLVTGGLWLLTLPVLVANLFVTWADLQGDVVVFFETGELAPGALRYLLWAFDQPQIFLYALPLLGVLAELVPVAAGRRQQMRGVLLGAIAAFGLLSFGAYAQPVYNERVASQPVFVVQNLLLLLPVLVVLATFALTLRGGRPKMSVPLGVAFGSLLVLLAGGAAGGLRVFGRFVGGLREFDDWSWVDDLAEPFDDLAGTAAVAGQFRLVVLAGLVGAVAGLYFWAPKVFGVRMSNGLGSLAGLALVGGAVVAAVPEVINGFLDEPDIAGAASVRDGVELLNGVATAGLALVALGVLAVFADLASSLARRDGVEADPWGGQTLEWSLPSPPPRGNISAPVTVSSEAPLLDGDDEEDQR